MRADECYKSGSIDSTSDQVVFNLLGGVYSMSTVATFGGGSVTLERLAGDGTTWVTSATAVSAAGVAAPLYLPSGQYRLTVVTATVVFVVISRVPHD